MTETEFLTSTDPVAMLNHLLYTRYATGQGKFISWQEPLIGDRKMRLFAFACWYLSNYSGQSWKIDLFPPAYRAMEKGEAIAEKGPLSITIARIWAEENPRIRGPEQALKSSILRDIAGNPFRPSLVRRNGKLGVRTGEEPTYDLDRGEALLTPAVIAIATEIYEERRFEDMPILADALIDAGCDCEVILAHCRGTIREFNIANGGESWWYNGGESWWYNDADPGGCHLTSDLAKPQHYRGCWLIDALLNKE